MFVTGYGTVLQGANEEWNRRPFVYSAPDGACGFCTQLAC